MAVVNEDNDKVLLGRNVCAPPRTILSCLRLYFQRKWPGRFYSALAGFIEPGEAFEDAVKRELWEEAGLKVWGIQYHSTQPWVRGLPRYALRVLLMSLHSPSHQTSW